MPRAVPEALDGESVRALNLPAVRQRCRNADVFIDTGARRPTCWPESFVKHTNRCGQDKMIFATDFPVPSLERTRADFAALKLKPVARNQVPRDNLRRVHKP